MGLFTTGTTGNMRGRTRPPAVPRERPRCQGGVGTSRAELRHISSMIVRVVRVLLLCLLVGLLLTRQDSVAAAILQGEAVAQRLGDRLDSKRAAGIADLVDVAIDRSERDAEVVGSNPFEFRNVIRNRPLAGREIFRVCLRSKPRTAAIGVPSFN